MPCSLRRHLRDLSQVLPNVRRNSNSLPPQTILIFSSRRLADVKLYGNASQTQAAMYDRDNPRYPYKSHGQWLKACYGLVACTLLVIFNGVGPFLEHPFDTRRFVASYIGVSLLSFSLCSCSSNS